MSHDTPKDPILQAKFVISTVALVFAVIWAIIGVSDLKIVASTLAFIFFLRYGIATEMQGHSGSH
jgi:hypothetical protein